MKKGKLTLKWMDLIRKRLESSPVGMDIKFKDIIAVNDFISPVLKYGEKEEKRILKALKGE